MHRHLLFRLLGFRGGLLHGDTLFLDRWRWASRLLPETKDTPWLLDAGCGNGAFTMGASKRGYQAIGVSWSETDLEVCRQRARIVGATTARFVQLDLRRLAHMTDWDQRFDVVLCFEAIEHIINDRALILEIADCLAPGGRLLLTTPNFYYRAISPTDNGPFSTTEDGSHVRRGYTPAMLLELCREAGLLVEELSYGSGLVSQKVTWLMRRLERANRAVAWACTLPLRALVLPLDGPATTLTKWPWFTIRIVAVKPRFKMQTVVTRPCK